MTMESADAEYAKELKDFATIMSTRSDVYASGPMCWGPLQWMAMHQMARGFPHNPTPEKQAAVKAYMVALVDLLPCSICAMHWGQIAPHVRTESRNAFLKWTIDVHNKVNKRTGKPVLTYPQALDTILNSCKDNCLSISTLKTKLHDSNVKSHTNTNSSKTLVYILSAICALLFITLVVLLFVSYAKSPKLSTLNSSKADMKISPLT